MRALFLYETLGVMPPTFKKLISYVSEEKQNQSLFVN